MTLWPFIWIRWQEISTLIESLFQEWHCSTFTRHGWPQETGCFYAGSHWFWVRAVSILNSKLNSITWLTEHPQHQQTQSLPFKHNLLNYPMEFFCQINLWSCHALPDQVKHQNSKHAAIRGKDQSFRSPRLMLLRKRCGQRARTGCPNSNSTELCSQTTGCCTKPLHPENTTA